MNARLSQDLVQRIRHAAAGGARCSQLARDHGLHVATVAKVVSGALHPEAGGPVRPRRGRLSTDATPEVVRAELLRRLPDMVTVTRAGCWVVSNSAATRPPRLEIAGVSHQARRLTYATLIGPLPPQVRLVHGCAFRDGWHGERGHDTCDRCVRPDHAVVLVGRQPPKQRAALVAPAAACPQGHVFDVRNTRYRKEGGGGWSRSCRQCARELSARRRELSRHCSVEESMPALHHGDDHEHCPL